MILDLDETLIYATEINLERDFNFIVGPYFVYKRPHLDEFLKFCLDNFEVAIWTSSTEIYADEVIENIFDYKDSISFVWARERCTISFDGEERISFYEKKILKVKRLGYAICVPSSSLTTAPKSGVRAMETWFVSNLFSAKLTTTS